MVENKKKGRKVGVAKREAKKRKEAKQYVGYLLELHRLQGALLQRLDERVR